MANIVAATTTYRPMCDVELIWDIENFEETLKGNYSLLTSQNLNVSMGNLGSKCYWIMNFRRVKSDLTFSLKLYCGPMNSEDQIHCSYKILLGEPGGTRIEKEGEQAYTHNTSATVYAVHSSAPKKPVKIRRNGLTSQRAKIYPREILRITAKLHVTLPRTTKIGARVFPVFENTLEASSANWIASLYNNSLYSDIVIKCQGTTFPCHRNILGRSSIFAAMFSTPMKESLNKEIVISDTEPFVLEMFLKTLYFLPVDLPTDYKVLLKLVDSAEKYDLVALKFKAFQKLCSLLTDDNAGELNIAAHRYSMAEDCQQFFKDYCFRRHDTLITNPAYAKIYNENIAIFT